MAPSLLRHAMNHSFAAKPASVTRVNRPDGPLVGAPDGSKALGETEEAWGKIPAIPGGVVPGEKKRKKEKKERKKEGVGLRGWW